VSKLGGELMLAATWEKHCIFRVCGLFGYAGRRDKKSNFVETMITLGRQGKPLKVVADQVLTPTSTSDVACKVKEVLDGGGQGLYHLTAAGECSWYEFTRAIFEVAGMSVEVEPVGSDAYPTRARRPNYSVLDNVRLRAEGYAEMPHWRESLERYIAGRHAAGRD
jgi:dTDP-4-dehydrorhamnose reductase